MRTRRVAGLDIVRGLAIGLVMIRHAAPQIFGGTGIAGVVVFFALSGYLITGLLVADVHGTGRLDLRRFYRNRALRLVPALAVFLAGLVVVTVAQAPHQWRAALANAATGAFYLSDLRLPLPPLDGVSHLWSLAVEEQFYLIWPLAVLIGVRLRRLPHVVLGAGTVALAALVATTLLVREPADAYTLPTTWALALLIGAAGRVWRDRVTALVRGRRGDVVSVACLAVLAGTCLPIEFKDYTETYVLGVPLLATAGLLLAVRSERWLSLPSRALLPLQVLGRISYACYLWNLLIVDELLRSGLPRLVQAPLGMLLTVAAALVSWVVVERPALARKERGTAPRGERTIELPKARSDPASTTLASGVGPAART